MAFIFDGPADAAAMGLLAHGAGAPMDMDFLNIVAQGLGAQGLRVARFEFAYMAARRTGGPKRPPPKVELLCDEYIEAIQALGSERPLVIGGKSMGGRVASMVADGLWDAGRIAGVLCLGYPFHPQGKPEKLRTAHLAQTRAPMLICQGTRDPFGTQAEAADYALSGTIRMHWLDDGDHDFVPRKRVTGQTQHALLTEVAEVSAGWIAGILRGS